MAGTDFIWHRVKVGLRRSAHLNHCGNRAFAVLGANDLNGAGSGPTGFCLKLRESGRWQSALCVAVLRPILDIRHKCADNNLTCHHIALGSQSDFVSLL